MDYIQVTFRTNELEDYTNDLIASFLGEIGFDSFEETGRGIVGYCPKNLFSEQAMVNVLNSLHCLNNEAICYSIVEIEDQNWNEVWEQSSFNAIEISKECVICPWNKQLPQKYKYEIILRPQQSFGSGYHETTRMMLMYLLSHDITGLSVLDMGTGTGVLSIMASMRGAKDITAIDIDEWSFRNAKDNIALNNVNSINVILGDVAAIPDAKRFDLVLANINRNILVADMEQYVNKMDDGAELVISGFYVSDMDILCDKAFSLGLQLIDSLEENEWSSLRFKKINV